MTTYWLARDEEPKHDDSYTLYGGVKPFKVEGMWALRTNATKAIAMFWPRAFVRVTGIYIRRGRCVEVKVTQLKRGFKFEVIKKGGG